MALNFRIAVHKDDENLHLKLMGDFDGSSAWEVINSLQANRLGISRIFIHTASLKKIHPFGVGILHSHLLDPIGKSVSVVYTGENALELAPETRWNARSGTKRILADGDAEAKFITSSFAESALTSVSRKHQNSCDVGDNQ